MKRYGVLFASILIQVCLGGIYAWSAFVPALRSTYGLTTSQTQLIFGCTIAVFTLAMLYAGRLQDKIGPRIVALIGGILFGAGYLIGSCSAGSFAWLLIGIGVIAGAGIGFGYICPLATCIKWFPRHKGLITGLSVAGFGGGAMLLSTLIEMFFTRGTDVLEAFQWIGITYGLAVVIGALFLFLPKQTEARSASLSITAKDLLADRRFWSLFIGMFCGTFAGLLVIGNLKPMGIAAGLSSPMASAGIGVLAIGNALGRVIWGWIYDRSGKIAVPLSLLVLTISILVLLMSGFSGMVFISACIMIGFGFGACFVLYAARVAATFGNETVGNIYPWIFLSYGLSGTTGPPVGGWLFDTMGSYLPAIILASALTGLGTFAYLLLDWRRESKCLTA